MITSDAVISGIRGIRETCVGDTYVIHVRRYVPGRVWCDTTLDVTLDLGTGTVLVSDWCRCSSDAGGLGSQRYPDRTGARADEEADEAVQHRCPVRAVGTVTSSERPVLVYGSTRSGRRSACLDDCARGRGYSP